MDDETTKEIARITGLTIEAVIKLSRFLAKVFGEGLVEVGGIAHDWVRYFRYRNLLCLQDKVDEIHQMRGIEGKTVPIPPRYAIPLIQNASLEDEQTVQNLWAGLISNATDPRKRMEVKKIYIQILSSLEPLDAMVLKFLSGQGWKALPGFPQQATNLEGLCGALDISKNGLMISLQNLARLGCVVDEQPATLHSFRNTTSSGLRVTDPNVVFKLSPLGQHLMQAVRIED